MKSLWKYPPSLLERLTNAHSSENISNFRRVDAENMRKRVIAEIMEILNHANIENTLDCERYAHIATSAMNYGLPKRGTYVLQDEWQTVEYDIRTAILRFEPRIIPETLIVKVLNDDENNGRYASILFELSALIYWFPEPLDLYVRGKYDTDSEHINIT